MRRRKMPHEQYGVTGGGLRAANLRDLDCLAVRPKMPARALPDDVRRNLGLKERKGSPFGLTDTRNEASEKKIVTKATKPKAVKSISSNKFQFR